MRKRQKVSADVLSVKEVADILRIGETTVRRLAASGELPAKMIGKRWRFSRQEILSLLPGRPQNGQPGASA